MLWLASHIHVYMFCPCEWHIMQLGMLIRPDCHHHFDASGTSSVMFDELAESSLMSPLAGTKHTYARLAIIILSLFSNTMLHILFL